MPPTVTAIVVAHRGPENLQRSLDAVAAQTRPADTLAVIGTGSDAATAAVAAAASPDHLLAAQERMPFGAALRAALRALPASSSDDEWLWLLGEDTAPEPDALARLVEHASVAPSVAVAGPKIVDGDEPSVIRELGVSMTRLGATVVLVEDELDQGQHDRLSDVMAVPAAGMLIRRTTWDALDGFDPGLPVFDAGLDLCVRVRLAGHRVVAVPSARVAGLATGVTAAVRTPRAGARARQHRQRRTAQLHRRMAYAPALALVFHWLSLVPLAVLRSIGLLVAKQPGAIGGEFAAAFVVAFGGSGVGRARRTLARARTVSWSALAPLRVPFSRVRHLRAVKREAYLVRLHGERREIDFLGGGGAWVVLAAVAISVAVFAPLLGASSLTGGGILPLSPVGHLWQSLGYGWRDIGIGFVGSADPFAAVLAVLGSLTFWQPSFAIVLLWFAAMPLAAMGAWFLSTRVTHRPVLRATFALVWAFAPMLFDALQQGRPADVLVHVLLPWLFFAATGARRSWAAAATTGILAAAVAACAPSLIPALVVIWVIGLALSGRGIARMIVTAVPAVVLFAPLALEQWMRGTPLALFADPGLPVPGATGHPLHVALGFSDGDLGGWQHLAASLGLPGTAASVIVPILMAPLAVLALLSLFLRGTIRATLCLVGALLGFATAVLTLNVSLSSTGSQTVGLFTGPSLSLYWLGLLAAATMALVALGRFAFVPALVTVVFAAVAVAPLAIAVPLGTSDVAASETAALPAYATAQAQAQPRTGTLVLDPQPDGSLGATLVHGAGETLDDQSTLSATRRAVSASERGLATLAGNLASRSGMDDDALLRRFGVQFVLLQTSAGDGGSPASATTLRAQTALASNPRLTQVAATDGSVLWSVPGQTRVVPVPADAGGLERTLVLVLDVIVFGVVLLLALPTGRTERGTLRRPTAAQIAASPRRTSRSGKGEAANAAPTGPAPAGPSPTDATGPIGSTRATGPAEAGSPVEEGDGHAE